MTWGSVRDPLEGDCFFDTGALGKLPDATPIDCLPGGGGRRPRWHTLGTPAADLLFGHQHIAAPGVEIDADTIAGSQAGKAAARGAFRGGIHDGRTVRGARLAPVAEGGQAHDAALEQRI